MVKHFSFLKCVSHPLVNGFARKIAVNQFVNLLMEKFLLQFNFFSISF